MEPGHNVSVEIVNSTMTSSEIKARYSVPKKHFHGQIELGYILNGWFMVTLIGLRDLWIVGLSPVLNPEQLSNMADSLAGPHINQWSVS